jgi:hypothetical protein
MTFVLRIIKWLLVVAAFYLMISLFMMNKNVEFQLQYYGLTEPLKVEFWQLVTAWFAAGLLVAGVCDSLTLLKWYFERRKMMKTDREHAGAVAKLDAKIRGIESDNLRLKAELDAKTKELDEKTKELIGAAPKFAEEPTSLPPGEPEKAS